MKKNLLVLSLTAFSLGSFAQTPRLSLFEEFTGETCPPCASTNPALNIKLAANYNKIAAIKWQVPIPSAPAAAWSLYKTNQAEIDWRFRSLANGGYGYIPAITSAPSSKIDGQDPSVFGGSSHPANLTNNVINTAQANMSAFSITMNRAWNATGTAITLTVNVVATATFNAVGPLVFRTVMVERLIQFSVQPGTNGEKEFEDVAIKSFPTLQSGVAMASNWIVGQTQTFTLNCPIPAYTRKKAQIAFVGFIQDDGDQKVAQAVRAEKALLTNDAVAASAKVPVTCGTTIDPVVTVYNNGADPITALTINAASDGVAGTPTPWTGNLAPGASVDIPVNSLPTTGTPGVHAFTYTITGTNAPDFELSNNTKKVSYLVGGAYQGTPVSQGFLLGAYPPAGFTIVNPDAGTAGWSRSTQTGAYETAPLNSSKYDFFNNTVIGDKDELYLPPMDLSGTSTPDMSFDMAYAQRDINSDDKLEVMASDDCGATWVTVFSSHGSLLATAAPVTTAYKPNDYTEWVTHVPSMAGFNKPSVLVKFVTTNDNGNNLYLDNINLIQLNPTTGITKQSSSLVSVELYPNPASSVTNLTINSARTMQAKVSVVNAIGQVVHAQPVNLTEGENNIELNTSGLATGIYNVTIDSEIGSAVKKLNVIK